MSELKYWAAALILMSAVSIVVAYPRFSGRAIFLIEFEFCIFYIPTLVLVLVCLNFMRTGAGSWS